MPSSPAKTVLVVYTHGAASPTQIEDAAVGLCEPVFCVDGKDRQLPVLERLIPGTSLVVYNGLEDLTKTAARLRPDGVVTFSERRVIDAATVAQVLGLPGNDPSCAMRLRSKALQRTALTDAGMAQPGFVTVDSPRDFEAAWVALGRQRCVVKPDAGYASRGIHVVTTQEDVAKLSTAISPDMGPWVLEEMMTGRRMPDPVYGDYLSVEVLSHQTRHLPVAVVARFPVRADLRERGGFFPSGLPEDLLVACSEEAVAAVSALGVADGVAHCELKLTPDGPAVIEVNGRLGGNVADILRLAGDYDIVREAIRVALAEVPSQPLWAPSGTPTGGHAFRLHLYAEGQRALEGVGGVDAVRALPQVLRVKQLVRTGAVLEAPGSEVIDPVVQVDGVVEKVGALTDVLASVSSMVSIY